MYIYLYSTDNIVSENNLLILHVYQSTRIYVYIELKWLIIWGHYPICSTISLALVMMLAPV